MDANKLARLKAIRYVVKKVCYNCMNSVLNDYGWGVCKMHEYTHQKHTDKVRQMSIYATGSCPYHRWNEDEDIHGYAEFAEE